MKALHITFRYGRGVYGGAELYMRRLSETIQKKGVNIDVCTTKSNSIHQKIKSTIFWDNTLEKETLNNIPVFRFPVWNPNRYLSFLFERLIQQQLDREESDRAEEIIQGIRNGKPVVGGLLLPGWNNIERSEKRVIRWSKGNASFLINDTNIHHITFSLFNPKGIPIKIAFQSPEYFTEISVDGICNWERFAYDLPSLSGTVVIQFKPTRTWRPLKDIRTISFAVSDIIYETDQGKNNIDLENDYRRHLAREGALINYLVSNARIRPRKYSSMFDYLRGPNSPEMKKWLERNIEQYDIILAQMFPFTTTGYSLVAKKFTKPLILLPLMHVDDEFYHWPHYYDQLKEADCIFAISMYSKTHLFDRLGVKSEYIGSGIEEQVFFHPSIDGSKFRKKYGLEDKRIILSVSRKNPSKRYDILTTAVAHILREYRDIHLVMIGPDDDNVPVDAPGISYIGIVSKNDLADAYDACTIFAMMSESESFGMVFCEAWSRKRPVIGNRNCGAVASLITEGVDGLMCNNVNELISAIKILLDDDRYAAELGKHGYEKVLEQYTWDKVANRALACYSELVGKMVE